MSARTGVPPSRAANIARFAELAKMQPQVPRFPIRSDIAGLRYFFGGSVGSPGCVLLGPIHAGPLIVRRSSDDGTTRPANRWFSGLPLTAGLNSS
jgi:hypothetical protein